MMPELIIPQGMIMWMTFSPWKLPDLPAILEVRFYMLLEVWGSV
jgi:hypothetical protein